MRYIKQPPSGGCVLKHWVNPRHNRPAIAAAFGRLCVETITIEKGFFSVVAAAFGRLCVETLLPLPGLRHLPAAAFGRLCVETRNKDNYATTN